MYRTLTTQEQVESLINGPQPVWLLKHSSICPISSAALEQFEQYGAEHPDQPEGLVIIQEQRPLSNWIATRLGRVHQSPQLFLIHGGKVRWHASHWSITVANMRKALVDTIPSAP